MSKQNKIVAWMQKGEIERPFGSLGHGKTIFPQKDYNYEKVVIRLKCDDDAMINEAATYLADLDVPICKFKNPSRYDKIKAWKRRLRNITAKPKEMSE